MKQYIIPVLFFWLFTVTCDKPVGTDLLDTGTSQVAVLITASNQAASKYRITISGPSMDTIGPQVHDSGQTIELYVPEGNKRKFYFERFNSSQQRTDTGVTISNIGSGMNTINVTMVKVATPPPESCSVSYNGNGNSGGNVPDTQRQIKGGILKLDINSGALVKTEYVFRGWNTEPDGKGKDYLPGSNYTADTSLVLYAKWVKLLTYTITYNGNGNTSGKVPAGQVKTEGVTASVAFNTDTLKKNGFTFVGWNTRDDGTGKDYAEGAGYISDSSVILYARWTQLQTYKITYHGNDSTGGTVPAAQTKIKGTALTLETNTGNLVKSGYSFKGWNTQADGKGKSYNEGDTYTSDTTMTLYARWEALPKYKVTYYGDDKSSGDVPEARSKLSGDTLIISGNTGNLRKIGHDFDGWRDSTGKVYKADSVYIVNANLSLYAKWKPQKFTVTFNGNQSTKGTVPAPQIKNYGEDLTLSDNTGNLEKAGFHFDGWRDSTGKEYAANSVYTENANVVLYANWKYMVTYNGNANDEGNVPAPQFKEIGKDLVLALNTGNLKKADYDFIGWSTSADGAGTEYAAGAKYTDDADVVLYAHWKHRPNTVTFMATLYDAGEVPAPQIKEYGKPLLLPGNTGNLRRTGFVFDGWSTSADGKGTDYYVGSYYSENVDVTLYAKWIPQTFTVKYNGNGNDAGYAPAAQVKTYGTSLTIASVSSTFKKTGSSFVGWNSSATGDGTDYAQNSTYSTEADLTLFAKWRALDTYSVKYDGNQYDGGSVPEVQTKTTDVPVVIDANSGSLTRTGYSFGGWATNSDGTGTLYTGGDSYTAGVSITLYAKWNPL